MAIDDVAVRSGQSEFTENHIADIRIVVQGIVCILGFRPSTFILDKPPFKGGHAIAAKDGTVASCPQEPEEIHAELALGGTGFCIIGLAGCGLCIIEEGLAAQIVTANREVHELSVLSHRNAAMEQKVPIEYLIEAAL